MSALPEPAPWDAAANGYPAWELRAADAAALAAAAGVAGHQTVRADPLADQSLLRQHGFQYADTLLEASATRAQLRALKPLDGHNMSVAAKIVSIRRETDVDAVLAVCGDAFAPGRFYRDAAVAPAVATLRYHAWLRRLAAGGTLYGLYAEGRLAGFIACQEHRLALYAVAPAFRGRGLARYWWRQVIVELLNAGHASVASAIPAGDMAALNLYATQGFSFRRAQALYHRIVK